MKEITTQRLKHTKTLFDKKISVYEIIITDSETGELRYNAIDISNKTADELWEISEPTDYSKARSLDYPEWHEQFDDQYWDEKNRTNNWLNKIEAIKNKYPKKL